MPEVMLRKKINENREIIQQVKVDLEQELSKNLKDLESVWQKEAATIRKENNESKKEL